MKTCATARLARARSVEGIVRLHDAGRDVQRLARVRGDKGRRVFQEAALSTGSEGTIGSVM